MNPIDLIRDQDMTNPVTDQNFQAAWILNYGKYKALLGCLGSQIAGEAVQDYYIVMLIFLIASSHIFQQVMWLNDYYGALVPQAAGAVQFLMVSR